MRSHSLSPACITFFSRAFALDGDKFSSFTKLFRLSRYSHEKGVKKGMSRLTHWVLSRKCRIHRHLLETAVIESHSLHQIFKALNRDKSSSHDAFGMARWATFEWARAI